MLEDVSNRSIPMPPTFLDDVPKALHGIFIQGILSITGVHAVKLSFLLFFRRLGRQMPKYMIFWWFVAFVTLASYAVSIALVEYKCMLSSLDVIFFECTANGETARQWTYMIAYCTIDAASDVLSKTASPFADRTLKLTSHSLVPPRRHSLAGPPHDPEEARSCRNLLLDLGNRRRDHYSR